MELASGVYSLAQRSYRSSYVHAFLLDDGEGLTLIDTLYDSDAKRILDQIESIGKRVTDLKQIVLTHGHRSHLGGLAVLKRLSGALVYAHEWEVDIIAGDRRAQPVNWRPMDPLLTYPIQLGFNLGFGDSHSPCQVDRTLRGGEQLGPLQVLHTPGHAPGHLAFYWPQRRVLFTGDAIVTWPKFMAGWPGFLLNVKQHQASIRRLAEFDAEILAVGHGDPILTNGAERVRSLLSK